jgi:hypothetical protein
MMGPSIRKAFFALLVSAMLLAAGSFSPLAEASEKTHPKRSWWIDMDRFLSSAHGRFSCSECHPDLHEKEKKHPDPALLSKESPRLYDYRRCGRCHPQELERTLSGAHAKALAEKKKDAPTCGHCHTSHYVRPGLSRLALGQWMTGMCAGCHPVQQRTYLDNIHGKTTALGSEIGAWCTDCHGAHTVLSLKSREEALEACRKCHSKAEARFTGFVVHAAPEGIKKEEADRLLKVRVIRWIEIGFGLLVFGVLAFFYSHTLLWLLRKTHEWLKERDKS